MRHLVVAVKTTEGGLWVLPQVREARRRGTRVTVITRSGDGRLTRALTAMTREDPEVVHHPSPFDFSFSRPWRVPAGLFRLRRLLRRLEPDAVLYHLYATALSVRLSTLGLRYRRVYMVAGPLYLDSRPIRLLERFLARLDSVIICGSEHIRQRYLSLRLPTDHLRTIPYGVDLKAYEPRSPQMVNREHLGLKNTTFVAVMVAYVYAPKRLVHRGEGIKGHRHLLEAWLTFHREHPESELILVGSGFDDAGERYRQRLKDDFLTRGDETGIIWVDSMDDVRDAYAAADVSISPSLSENHGAVLEASSMSVPSIVSDAGALPEAVTSTSGWIFPAGSVTALGQQLSSAFTEWEAGSLDAWGEHARDLMVERFDLSVLVRRVIDCTDG